MNEVTIPFQLTKIRHTKQQMAIFCRKNPPALMHKDTPRSYKVSSVGKTSESLKKQSDRVRCPLTAAQAVCLTQPILRRMNRVKRETEQTRLIGLTAQTWSEKL